MLFVFIYGLFCIFFAWFNYWMIEVKRWRVRHFWNGLLHLCISALIAYFTYWNYGLANLFMTRAVFDLSLNLWRGLGPDYVSPNPKSIVDQLEKWLFRNKGLLPKIFYLIITIILLFI